MQALRSVLFPLLWWITNVHLTHSHSLLSITLPYTHTASAPSLSISVFEGRYPGYSSLLMFRSPSSEPTSSDIMDSWLTSNNANSLTLAHTSTYRASSLLVSLHTPLFPRSCFLNLLSEFPAITQVPAPDTPVRHDVVHYIETVGPPVSARLRCLAPECLKAAKKEFDHMLQLGIIQPSSSAWSTLFHMVQENPWRLVSMW